jgi:hypothetical protein
MSSNHLPSPHTVRESRVQDRPSTLIVVGPKVRVHARRDRRDAWPKIDWTRFTDAPPAINADAA